MDFQQINVVSSAPSLLAGQDQGPVLLFNASQDTAVWLGSDPFNTVAGDTSSTAQLPPLASVVIDGSQSVYGSCLPGQSAQVSVIPGGLNFFQLVEILVKTLLISASAGNGLFVYSGTPALGNLIASIVASATNDPFGNAVGAGFNIGDQSGGGAHFGVAPNGNVFISNSLGQNVIQIHPDLGAVLLYSGLPAAGNLICSVASADGTDPQNNAFLAGTTTYGPGGIGFTATQLENGIINFWQALTEAGPWTPTGTIACNGSIFLNCNQFVIPEVPIVPLDPRNPATGETWHYVGTAGEPAFGAAWGNAGGFAPLAFRRTASPANEVEIKGTIATTAAAPNNNIFTLPAVGYVPANSQRFGQSTAAVPAAACNIQVASGTGIVQVSNAPGGVATTIGVDIRVSLDL